MQITIKEENGTEKAFDIMPGIYNVGRDEDCRIHLQDGAVSHRHAILTVDESLSWMDEPRPRALCSGSLAGSFRE